MLRLGICGPGLRGSWVAPLGSIQHSTFVGFLWPNGSIWLHAEIGQEPFSACWLRPHKETNKINFSRQDIVQDYQSNIVCGHLANTLGWITVKNMTALVVSKSNGQPSSGSDTKTWWHSLPCFPGSTDPLTEGTKGLDPWWQEQTGRQLHTDSMAMSIN